MSFGPPQIGDQLRHGMAILGATRPIALKTSPRNRKRRKNAQRRTACATRRASTTCQYWHGEIVRLAQAYWNQVKVRPCHDRRLCGLGITCAHEWCTDAFRVQASRDLSSSGTGTIPLCTHNTCPELNEESKRRKYSGARAETNPFTQAASWSHLRQLHTWPRRWPPD